MRQPFWRTASRVGFRAVLVCVAATVAATAATAGFAAAAGGAGGDHAQLVSLQHTVQRLQHKQRATENQLRNDEKDLIADLVSIITRVNEATHALRTPNVVKVVSTQTLPTDGAVTVDAFCPAGDQVISGGYIQGANNGEVTRAIQIQKPKPGYEVSVFEQPGIANGNQDAQVTALAYCAPTGTDDVKEPPKAVVFGPEIPTN
jgi:hypothetical protein